jgi:hypothetical protein
MVDPQQLQIALSQLPLFEGRRPEVEAPGEQAGATQRFRVAWGTSSAVLKLYGEPEDSSPLVRAKYRAAAEAEGLRIFAPVGLAPNLLWQGTLPGANGPRAALISVVQGENVDGGVLSEQQITSIVAALKEIHGETTASRLVSSTPRNLEAWWARAHEAYRELPGIGEGSMPESARDALDTLLHAISADAQAHKRYWQSAPLAPVQGSPGFDNLRLHDQRPVFIDWECFGMGDTSLEVATWAGLVGLRSGGEARDRFVSEYLEGNEDELLPARIKIYRRFWAFGYALPLLARAEEQGKRPQPGDEARMIIECIALLMAEYERPAEEIDRVRADLAHWLGAGED